MFHINYSTHVTGPQLSAVFTPAFAIKAFVTLATEVVLAGEQEARKRLEEFESEPFMSRIKLLAKQDVPPDLPLVLDVNITVVSATPPTRLCIN